MRRGFTLVELLVVISLLLLVTVMTIGAVNFTLTTERIREGSRKVQSYLEGARNRAVYAKEPRGVRFMLDQTRNAKGLRVGVSSMVYIGPVEPWSEGQVVVTRPDVAPRDNIPDADEVTFVLGFGTGWYDLATRGLIHHLRSRIRIPAGPDGTWYTVSTQYLDANNELLQLATEYASPANTPASAVIAITPPPSSYELELPWSPLPNQEPAVLPSGIVVDLRYSAIPGGWVVGTDTSFTPPEPIYAAEMDLHFSPRGTVIGPAAAMGVIHFWLAKQEDVDLGRLPLDPESGEELLVSLFTQTGNTASFPVDQTDGDGDQIPDDAFRFAETGATAR